MVRSTLIVAIVNLSTPDSVNRAQPIFACLNFQVFEVSWWRPVEDQFGQWWSTHKCCSPPKQIGGVLIDHWSIEWQRWPQLRCFWLITNLCGFVSQSKLVFPELKLLSPRLVLDPLPEIEDLLFLENWILSGWLITKVSDGLICNCIGRVVFTWYQTKNHFLPNVLEI